MGHCLQRRINVLLSSGNTTSSPRLPCTHQHEAQRCSPACVVQHEAVVEERGDAHVGQQLHCGTCANLDGRVTY